MCTSSLLALVDPPSPRSTPERVFGYAQTLKNLNYFDIDSHDVKSGQHARYDEGMNDVTDTPPNARLVRFAQRRELSPQKPYFLEPLDLDVAENPFQDLRTLSVLAEGEDTHLGFVFSKCSHRLHIYLSNLQSRTPGAGIRNGHRQIVGAYAVSIHGRTVFTVEQANLALTVAFNANAAGDPIELFSIPSLAPMQLTFVVQPCIFNCLNSRGSTLLLPFRGRAVLNLCLLPSLHSRTRILTTQICSKRFVRFVETNWMMLALMN